MTTKNSTQQKIVYVDMDNVLVDFEHGIERLSAEDREKYQTSYDDCPRIFELMRPMPGAVEGFHQLTEHFDVYILSTAPWDNPAAWQHKVEWVQKYLAPDKNAPAYKRLILSHHKNLNKGDFLIDDRPNSGADRFEGELLVFGKGKRFPTWESVVHYLMGQI